MNRLVLRFNTGGKCQLCGKRRETTDSLSLLKRTVQLISEDCFVLMQVCFACILQATTEAIKEDCVIEKEIMVLEGHDLHIRRVKD